CAVGVMTVEMLPVSEGEARKILGKATATPPDTTPSSAGISVKPKRESARVHLASAQKSGESQALARQRPSSTPPNGSNTSSVLVGISAGLLVAIVLGALLLTGGSKPK